MSHLLLAMAFAAGAAEHARILDEQHAKRPVGSQDAANHQYTTAAARAQYSPTPGNFMGSSESHVAAQLAQNLCPAGQGEADQQRGNDHGL